MKRSLLLLLVLILVTAALPACKKDGESSLPTFSLTEDGFGYVNDETGVVYTAADFCYQSIATGEAVGTYTHKKTGYVHTLYRIKGLDPEKYLTDEDGSVWCAGEALTNPQSWTLQSVIFCEEDAVSVEANRFSKGTDDEAIAEVCRLWFSGEEIEKPTAELLKFRSVKLVSEELPQICYVFDFYLYEDGGAVFFELFSGRCVAVPAALIERIVPGESEAA